MNDFISDISQADLDGFVASNKLRYTIGATNPREYDAATRGIDSTRYWVVDASDIAVHRTDDASDDARPYLTHAEALTLLPSAYRSFVKHGQTYPAAKSIKTVDVRGFLGSAVERARQQLVEYRANEEVKRLARVAERKATMDRWLNGDADVRVRFETLTQDRYSASSYDVNPV